MQRISHNFVIGLRITAILMVSVLLSKSAIAQTTGLGSAELDLYIELKMRQMRTPGLGVAVVKNKSVVWAKGFGLADIENQVAATADTPFTQASISKMFTATAVMQLWEQGKLGLDDDINGYLPFPIRNPQFPDIPITFRMLLTHSSSIQERYFDIPLIFGTDCPVSLADFLESYLVPGGSLYGPTLSFYPFPPGTQFVYCNIGYGLLGYLVERISGKPFDQYCQDHLFNPLGMTDTSWRAADFPGFSVAPAKTYWYDLTAQSNPLIGFPGWAPYPAATLTASANQLGKWLVAIMNGGAFQDVQVVQPQTMALMQTPVFDFQNAGARLGYGLGFFNIEKSGREHDLLIGHSGAFDGILTILFYRPAQRVGVAIMANGAYVNLPSGGQILPNGWLRAEYYFLLHRLLEEAAALP